MALTSEYIEEIKRILDSISSSLPGYIPRMSQKRMIAAVAEVLSRAADADGEEVPENTGRSILAVQGPTGVGKSLAYLIGGVVAARLKNRKLVISSATVALQEQLIARDVPFFVKHAGVPMTFAIAKGRKRYVCHHKLSAVAFDGAQDDMFVSKVLWDYKPDLKDVKQLKMLHADYNNGCWSGDRDELDKPLSDELWAQITTDRHGCLNRNCKSYSICAQMAAREKVRDADIIVANHDLLLADMSLGGGALLPAPSETFYVLDEGHHIAQKGVESFAHQHQVKAGQGLVEKVAVIAGRIGQTFPELSAMTAGIDDDAQMLGDALSDVFLMLDSIDKDNFAQNGNLWRFPDNKLPAEADTLSSNVLQLSTNLTKDLGKLYEKLADKKKSTPEDARLERFLVDIGFFSGKVGNIRETWEVLCEAPVDDDQAPPVAKWVSLETKKQGKYDFTICACPVSAADALADMFFKKANGVIVASATLMTMGNFDQLLRETGLVNLPDTSLLALPSPFNFIEQGVISIPDLKVSPKDGRAHTGAIAKAMPELICKTGNRGTLVLFASRWQMMDVAQAIPSEFQSLLLIQGEKPKDALLAEHYARIDQGKPSVLFGLQSFAEGLDLPGNYCAHVVITKIPFAVPSDPVQQTLEQWLSQNKRNYFDEVVMPQACLRMIQAAGRLIRTESDNGILTVLDNRLLNTRYGRKILDSLPPFRMAA